MKNAKDTVDHKAGANNDLFLYLLIFGEVFGFQKPQFKILTDFVCKTDLLVKDQRHIFLLVMVVDIFQAFGRDDHNVVYGNGNLQVSKILIHVGNVGIL